MASAFQPPNFLSMSQRPATLSFCTQKLNTTQLTPTPQSLGTPSTPGSVKRKQHFQDQFESEFGPPPTKLFTVDSVAESTVMKDGYYLDETVWQEDQWTPSSTESGIDTNTTYSKEDGDKVGLNIWDWFLHDTNGQTANTPFTPGGTLWKVAKRRLTPASTPMGGFDSSFDTGSTGVLFDIPSNSANTPQDTDDGYCDEYEYW